MFINKNRIPIRVSEKFKKSKNNVMSTAKMIMMFVERLLCGKRRVVIKETITKPIKFQSQKLKGSQ